MASLPGSALPAVRVLLTASLLAVCSLPACGFDPGPGSGVPCGAHAECPPDRSCYRGYCVVGSGGPCTTPGHPDCVDGAVAVVPCASAADEGCACVIGTRKPCYEGPAGTGGVGACTMGTQSCEREGDAARFGACTGVVTPVSESCANAGRDDDCNGVVDDVTAGAACEVRGARGACRSGFEGCATDGTPSCIGSAPRTETCDSIDDDCDGDTDEGFSLDRDPLHCGACGHACGPMSSCVEGACCGAGSVECDGECVDVQTDENHCGRCGRECDRDETCTAGCCCESGEDCRCP